MVFHKALRDSKSPQDSWILLNILANLNNAVIFIVLIPLISTSSLSLFSKLLETIASAPTTIVITVIFMFHCLFSYQARTQVFVYFFAFCVCLHCVVRWNSKIQKMTSFFFALINIQSGLLAGIRWFVCTSKSQRILCVSFSRTDSILCICHLIVWWNNNLLHNSLWIIFPTQSCHVLYSFWTSLSQLCD